MDKLQALKLFAKVVQEKSLSAAARKARLSTATVSRFISSLEAEVGVRLLIRSSRNVAPTPAGQAYYEKVSEILQALEAADASTRAIERDPSGSLRIHTTPQFGSLMLAPAVRIFVSRYPAIRIDLRVTDDEANFIDGGCDIDVRMGKLADSSLLRRKLMTTEMVVCAAPSYLRSRGTPTRPEDLSEHNCLDNTLRNKPGVWLFQKDNTTAKVAVSGNITSNNGDILRLEAIGGCGIVLLRDWALAADIGAGRLVRLFPDYKATYSNFEDGLYAVYPKSDYQPARLTLFLDFLVDYLKGVR